MFSNFDSVSPNETKDRLAQSLSAMHALLACPRCKVISEFLDPSVRVTHCAHVYCNHKGNSCFDQDDGRCRLCVETRYV